MFTIFIIRLDCVFEHSDDAYRYAFIKNLQYTIDYEVDTTGDPDDYLTNEDHTYEERCKYFEHNSRVIFRGSEYKLYKVKKLVESFSSP